MHLIAGGANSNTHILPFIKIAAIRLALESVDSYARSLQGVEFDERPSKLGKAIVK
jgi:hypothetical protein